MAGRIDSRCVRTGHERSSRGERASSGLSTAVNLGLSPVAAGRPALPVPKPGATGIASLSAPRPRMLCDIAGNGVGAEECDVRLGVLDVGSNTVHLLVVDAEPGARPMPAAD